MSCGANSSHAACLQLVYFYTGKFIRIFFQCYCPADTCGAENHQGWILVPYSTFCRFCSTEDPTDTVRAAWAALKHRSPRTSPCVTVSAQAWRARPAAASSRPARQGLVPGAAMACGLRPPCTRGAPRQALAVRSWKQRVQGSFCLRNSP